MLRDDPYYISDDRSAPRENFDVDAIPVVRLDDLPPLASGAMQSPQTAASLPSTPPTQSAPQTSFTIDRGGEMPPNAVKKPIPSTPGQAATPSFVSTPARSGTPVVPPSSYPAYELDDDIPRTNTPELIKVTRVKKKGTGTGKKKRTKEPPPGDVNIKDGG